MVNLSRKLAYSFGAVATALSYQAFSTYIIFFYVDVLKLMPHLVALGMIIYGLWNAINDPIVGFLSDRTRTKWGRRIPYIALGAIPFGLIYFLLWVPPFTAYHQWPLLFAYFIFFICLFDGFYTVCILNWASLYPEMFPTLSERSEVNTYRQTFGMFGLMTGIALPPLIYSSWGWKWMGAIFGFLISFALLISLWGAKEKKEFSLDKPLPLKTALITTFTNHSFLTFVFANLGVQYTFTLILATIPFFAKYVLKADPPQTTLILLMAFLVAIPLLYVWRKLSLKWGAKKCFLFSLLTLALFLVPLLFVKNIISTLIFSALLGIGLAGFILLVDVLLADIIDEDELKTGTRREGMYFGINAFITRLAIGLEALSMAVIFNLTNYNPYLFTQPKEFLWGLRFLIAGLPVLALIFSFVVIFFYPLTGKYLEGMKIQLQELHKKKGVI